MNANYTYRVTYSAEDGEFLATVAEFPSLSWLGEDPVDALRGLTEIVADVVVDLRKSGEPVPEPLVDRRYSGKFNVRVPESLHRELAVAAAEQGVSLNRVASDRLAHEPQQPVRLTTAKRAAPAKAAAKKATPARKAAPAKKGTATKKDAITDRPRSRA